MLQNNILPVLYFVFVFLLRQIHSMAVHDAKSSMSFLNRFGYISDKEMTTRNMSMSDPMVQTSLKIFQEYTGLRVTGTLNNETMQMMSKSRCGNKDMSVMRRMMKNPTRRSIRKKRFSTHSTWTKNVVTYELLNYPKCCINKSIADRDIAQAFSFWQNEIPISRLRIRKREDNEPRADIAIRFAVDPHEDNLYFGDMENMSGRATAHAFYPLQDDPKDEIRGDIHFNNRENWTSGVKTGQNFLQTAIHEIGHSLGLEHSMEREAVMYFRVLPFMENFELHSDDVQGIKALYDNANEFSDNGNDNMLARHFPMPRIGSASARPKVVKPNKPEQTPIPDFQNQIPVAFPPPPISHKSSGWHCQKLYHAIGHTVMIAEQCLGDPSGSTQLQLQDPNVPDARRHQIN